MLSNKLLPRVFWGMLSLASVVAHGEDFTLKLFYVPFGVKTDVPITSKSIEKNAIITIVLRSFASSKAFDGMIEMAHGKCDADMQNIHMKLYIYNDIYLFDGNGCGIKNGKMHCHIDIEKVKNVISTEKIAMPLN